MLLVAWDSPAPSEGCTVCYPSKSQDQWANCYTLGIILAALFTTIFSLVHHYFLLLRKAQANVASS